MTNLLNMVYDIVALNDMFTSQCYIVAINNLCIAKSKTHFTRNCNMGHITDEQTVDVNQQVKPTDINCFQSLEEQYQGRTFPCTGKYIQ